MNWYIQVLSKYAEFNGRARRSEYWYFALFNLIFILSLLFIDSIVDFYGVFSVIYYLGILVPSLAVLVRRLHDTGRSGWNLLIAFIPIVGSIILLVFLASDSNMGDNQYGVYQNNK